MHHELKIVSLDELVKKNLERKIGLCSGGFDFLHVGHILHFEFAKKMCATLIVAINSDRTFPDKGKGRPVFPEQRRASIIAAIEFVDFVVIYAGPFPNPEEAKGIIHGKVQSTPYIPLGIITRVRPDYYFKGIEYEGKEIPERRIMEDHGGTVVYGPREPVFSSSKILRDLQA